MTQMRAFFRVDASLEIGLGHIHRCLAIAVALSNEGVNCSFISRNLEGFPKDLIKSKGINLELISIPDLSSKNNNDPINFAESEWSYDATATKNIIKNACDFLIVDHYQIDHLWEKELKDFTKQIVVIDDLANRKHDCDFLIDQNLGTSIDDYKNLVSKHTKLFIGPKYALLRPEFKKYREYSLKRRQNASVKNILISLGGTDKSNFIEKILSSLKRIQTKKFSKIDVVLGRGNNRMDHLKEVYKDLPFVINFYENLNNIAEKMSESDLIIGAGGISSWERCSLGIPSIIFALAENQRKGASALEKEKCSILINKDEGFDGDLVTAFNYYSNKSNLTKSINQCKNICDGNGVENIIKAIFVNE